MALSLLEEEHWRANKGVLYTDITKESFEIYSKRKAKFQLVSIVVNAYSFRDAEGVVHAKPYNISLFPFQREEKVQYISNFDYLKTIIMSEINSSSSIYI